MAIDKKTREEWRELAQTGMHSALGEYTPVDEFVALLDYIDELEAQLTMRAADWLPCGHHKDAIVGNGVTQWCVACEAANR